MSEQQQVEKWRRFLDEAITPVRLRESLVKHMCHGFDSFDDYVQYGECFHLLRESDYNDPAIQPFLIPKSDPGK